MPKTWTPHDDSKSRKAFAKAVRALSANKGRQFRPRPSR
jgi:hypothetical protein